MKLEHYYVNIIDLPEILPFTLQPEQTDDIAKDVEAQEESGKALFSFIEALEDDFDAIHYIGQDNIEGRFYQRFLFEGGGFVEVMQKAPCAIIAHFSDEERAEAFVEALQSIVRQTATDDAAAELLANDINVSKETEGSLSYDQWSKMNRVRKSVGG